MTAHVIVPLDGSALAEAALPAAVMFARAEGLGLELLAVVEPLPRTPESARLMSLLSEGLQARLNTTAETLRADGLVVEVTVREGDPADTIISHARTQRAALIVMSTHGLGGLDRWLVGSVTDKVARFAACPVVVIRPPADAPEQAPSWQARRLLTPLDGSPLAEQALPVAYRWAGRLDTELLLVRVQPWLSVQFAAADGYMPDLSTWEEEAAQAAEAYLAEVSRQAPPEVRVRTLVLRGDPASQLLGCCEAEAVDLVVMTSHGRGALGRLAMGSVADRIVRHGPPVAIVHPAPAAPVDETGERVNEWS